MTSTAAYMNRHAFGDYTNAPAVVREEMEDAALAYAAHEQTRPTIFKGIGLAAARERFEADRATAADLMSLTSAGTITAEQAQDYRARHEWSPRKH